MKVRGMRLRRIAVLCTVLARFTDWVLIWIRIVRAACHCQTSAANGSARPVLPAAWAVRASDTLSACERAGMAGQQVGERVDALHLLAEHFLGALQVGEAVRPGKVAAEAAT